MDNADRTRREATLRRRRAVALAAIAAVALALGLGAGWPVGEHGHRERTAGIARQPDVHRTARSVLASIGEPFLDDAIGGAPQRVGDGADVIKPGAQFHRHPRLA